jgi:hypothetical protein
MRAVGKKSSGVLDLNNIPMVLVDDLFANDKMDHIGGHAKYYRHHGDTEDMPFRGLHIICPKCGHLAGIHFSELGWKWDGNIEKPTCTPSILHDSPKCGWHVYLTNGVFTGC